MSYANYQEIREKLRGHQEFEGNSLSAERSPAWVNRGMLPASFELPEKPRYVVSSYATPIAWIDAEGFLTIPDVRYSRTTSRGQGLCRTWLKPDYDAQQILNFIAEADRLAAQGAIRSILVGAS